ncbi:MAG: hypothetical protein ABJF05_11235 [Paracoccaceae bacterium]
MLETLDEIDWSRLTHAYGPALDVPDLIRTVAHGPKPDAEKAWYDLYGNLWHQGTIYAATSHAVPFFIELVGDQKRSDAATILQYLQDLSEGTSYLDVHRDGQTLFGKKLSDEELRQVELELGWVCETRNAVRQGLPIYERLKGSADPEVVEAANSLVESLSND